MKKVQIEYKYTIIGTLSRLYIGIHIIIAVLMYLGEKVTEHYPTYASCGTQGLFERPTGCLYFDITGLTCIYLIIVTVFRVKYGDKEL